MKKSRIMTVAMVGCAVAAMARIVLAAIK